MMMTFTKNEDLSLISIYLSDFIWIYHVERYKKINKD